jgi:hypothetical protein
MGWAGYGSVSKDHSCGLVGRIIYWALTHVRIIYWALTHIQFLVFFVQGYENLFLENLDPATGLQHPSPT